MRKKPTPVLWQALRSDVGGSLYALAAILTTVYLILFDRSVYTSAWWNWIVAFFVDLGLGVFWPITWFIGLIGLLDHIGR